MVDRNKMLVVAIKEIGYHEKASNAYLDDPIANAGNGNYTKYAEYIDRIPDWYNGPKQGYEWCAVFGHYPYIVAYGVELARKLLCLPKYSAGAGCVYGAQYYKNAGRWFYQPEVGDQIFFDYGDGIGHVGIVSAVTESIVITIEGNSNGQVQHCEYPLGARYIAGYGRPCWELYNEDDAATDPAESAVPADKICKVEVDMPILVYGDVSWHVSLMQLILIGRGFSCGKYGADGDFGSQTKIALYEFQLANGILAEDEKPSCICDSDTWAKLLSL